VRRLTRLREERQRSRLTQEELANISGVNRVTIARLETGAARAKPETTDRLARALKVKPEDLIEDLI
jgi:transcriptional regulator with XRE-family HTH domain